MDHAVCFDLMGTLITDPYREAIAAAVTMPLGAVWAVKDRDSWPAFEIADIDEAEFLRRFFADPDAGHGFDVDAFHAARRAGYRWLPGMRDLVAELRGRAQRHIASNYPVWIEELRCTFRLDDLCEGVWASHHLGVRKPDPAFYERLVGKIGLEPDACLFVDDRAENCVGAEAAGMRAHLFVGAPDLRARLRGEGLLD